MSCTKQANRLLGQNFVGLEKLVLHVLWECPTLEAYFYVILLAPGLLNADYDIPA
jgi:hypothetical protein